MAHYDEMEQLTLQQRLSLMTVPQLKDFVVPLGRPTATRKDDLIKEVAVKLLNLTSLKDIYQRLGALDKQAVQEATHHPKGFLNQFQFQAKYGGRLTFQQGRQDHETPTSLGLIFPHTKVLPTDVRALLLMFVPKPILIKAVPVDSLPAHVVIPNDGTLESDEIELQVRETELDACSDLKAVLRLIDAGEIKVGEATARPAKASMKKIHNVLSNGDFYGEDDEPRDDPQGPAGDLVIKPFAWPLLVQAAGLVAKSGSKLQLTDAGRTAFAKPAHQVIDQIWSKWLKTKLLDEFNRVNAIKGQNGRNGLTAVEPRRKVIVEALRQCTPGKWFPIGQFFRVLKASEASFSISHDEWNLYIDSREYGNFADAGSDTWDLLQGRYTLTLLFEYAATLGLIDVAYIFPEWARDDFHDIWGTDGMSCLSRYDGLMYFRVNPLGAFCLGLAKKYEPVVPVVERTLQVLPNLDVVATDQKPSKADALFLERITEHKSEVVWRLSREKILAAVESGMAFGEVREFLISRIEGELPQTAEVFLSDLGEKADQLQDLVDARIVVCKDPMVALTIVSDRRLKSICQLAGDRQIVFKASDETAIRKVLRGMGYVLPK